MLNIYGKLLELGGQPQSLVLIAIILKVDRVKCLYFYPSVSAALLFSALDPLIYRHDVGGSVSMCVITHCKTLAKSHLLCPDVITRSNATLLP